jgi:hypothetical protein
MAVAVDQLTTEVIPEPEPSSANGSPDKDQTWEIVMRAREAHARLLRDRSRTAAEAFDD